MSIITILSYCIDITKKNNLKILHYFFIDYSKNHLTRNKLILLHIHMLNIKENELYKLLEKWIINHGDNILKKIIY